MKSKKIFMTMAVVILGATTFSACSNKELVLRSETIQLELGTAPDMTAISYVELGEKEAAEAIVDFSAVDIMTVGTYTAVINYREQSVNFSVNIEDTTAPEAEAVEEVTVTSGMPLYVKDVLTSVTELSGEVAISFQAVSDAAASNATLDDGTEVAGNTEQSTGTKTVSGTEQQEEVIPQDGTERPVGTAVESFDLAGVTCNNISVTYTENGEYDNTLTITDVAGNSTEVTVHIVVGSAPVFKGVEDTTATVGAESVDYLDGISAVDFNGTDITGKIVCDSSLVDLGTVGEYEIAYTVTDETGFTAAEKAIVTVAEETRKTETGKNMDKKNSTTKDTSKNTGSAGNTGNTNSTGNAGNIGSSGNTGGAGSTGNTGSTGNGTGSTGSTGNTGSTDNGGGSISTSGGNSTGGGSTGGTSGGTGGDNTNQTTPPSQTPTLDPTPDTGNGDGEYDMEVPDGVAPPNEDNTFVPQPGTGSDDGSGLGDVIK